jgi:hypothetical protein
MDVAGQCGEICFFFNEDAFVPALIEVTASFVAAVEESGVGYVEVAHEFAKITEWSFHQKVKVVVHENIGVEFDGIDIQRPGQETEKGSPVFIVTEDVPAFVSTAGDMVHRSGILYA